MKQLRNMKQIRELCETSPVGPNCWNTTMWIHGAMETREWIDDTTILQWVNSKCVSIKSEDVRVGDICLFFSDLRQLWHSVVYIGKGLWFHKRGTHYRYELTTWNEIMLHNIYSDSSNPQEAQYWQTHHSFYRVKEKSR